MSEKADEILQQMQELLTAVKDHQDDRATIDYEALAQMVVEKQAALMAEQTPPDDPVVPEQPVRRGEEIPAPGEGVPVRGKYAGEDPVNLLLSKMALDGAAAFPNSQVRPASKALNDAVEKALTSTGSGTGDEYVPTMHAAQLWEDFHLASRVAANLPRVNMPTNPFELPVEWGDVTWYKGSENSGATASDPATSKKTLTATKQIAEVNFSYELDEDSIIAVMPSLRASLTRQGGEQIDRFLIRADSTDAATGNLNSDDADPAATAWYLSAGEDGIHHQWLLDNTDMANDAGGDALTAADIEGALRDMAKYAVDFENVVIFAEPKTYLAMSTLDDVRTVDKYGMNATILTGELARFGGVPVIPTPAQFLAEADGKKSDTASNNTLGTLSIVHLPSWAMGFRRELLIEVDRDIQNQKHIMVISFRIAIAARGTRSGNTHTAGVYNILV